MRIPRSPSRSSGLCRLQGPRGAWCAALILLGRYDEALRAIDTALDINPHNEVAWLNKGNAFTKLGRLVDALRCFNAAIKVNPTYEVAWNNKGNALARLGKFEEALGCYERALEIDAAYRGAWVNKGFVLTKLGRFDEAALCADRAWGLERGRRAELICPASPCAVSREKIRPSIRRWRWAASDRTRSRPGPRTGRATRPTPSSPAGAGTLRLGAACVRSPLDVVRDERDPRGPGFCLSAHEAQVDPGARPSRSELDPVARRLRRAH